MPETSVFRARGFKLNYVSRTKNGSIITKNKRSSTRVHHLDAPTILKKVEIYDDEPVCIICYDAENEGEKQITLGCSHTFHEACIEDWFSEMRNCPTCRAKFYTDNYVDFLPEEIDDYPEDYGEEME